MKIQNYLFLASALALGSYAQSASASIATFYANGYDATHLQGQDVDAPYKLNQGGTKTLNINYAIGSNWNVSSAQLWLKLADDACVGGHSYTTPCPDSTTAQGYDGAETAGISKIEGSNVSLPTIAVNNYNWYQFNIPDFTNKLLSSYTSPLTLVLKAVSGDFYYKNAKIVIDYTIKLPPPVTSVPLPAAVWLFGSALLGLVGASRRKGKV